MSNKDGGGAAFPSAGVVIDYDKNEHQQGAYEGMSLRDYFAAKAMQGMCAAPYHPASDENMLSRDAYAMADSMLAARSA